MNFENANKLRGYLKEETKRLKIHSNNIYTIYFTKMFLERLFRNSDEHFVVKGSIAQLANIKQFTRPITDIDAVSYLNLSDSSYFLEKIIELNDDPIKYNFREKFITTRNTACIKIICTFDTIQHMIQFDMKKDESRNFVRAELPPILKGDKSIEINTIPIEQSIGNKLYVILSSAIFNIESNKKIRRFKDFYDLYNLTDTLGYDMSLVKKYLRDNFEKYGEIDYEVIDPNFFDSEFVERNKDEYENEAKKLFFQKDVPFEEIVNNSRDMVDKVTSR